MSPSTPCLYRWWCVAGCSPLPRPYPWKMSDHSDAVYLAMDSAQDHLTTLTMETEPRAAFHAVLSPQVLTITKTGRWEVSWDAEGVRLRHLGPPCPASANLAGGHVPCDWPTGEDGSHDGWAHANREHQLVWQG